MAAATTAANRACPLPPPAPLGADTNITQAASCGLMEDMFAAADAAVHPNARPDTPGWAESKRRGMHKAGVNPWLAESKHDWSGHASAVRGHPQRGPFMNVRVTHAGTMVPLLGALGLEVGEPYIMGMREHFHVYSREPIPPGAPPVDFNATMRLHQWNRLLALGYGLLEPAAKGGVGALVPRYVPGKVPPPPPPPPSSPDAGQMDMGGGFSEFDPSGFAPGVSLSSPERPGLQDLVQDGLKPDPRTTPTTPGMDEMGELYVQDNVDTQSVDMEQAREASLQRLTTKSVGLEDPVYGIAKLGAQLSGSQFLQYVPRQYREYVKVEGRGKLSLRTALIKHPLTGTRMSPMGGNLALMLFECGPRPGARRRSPRDAPVKYKMAAALHGRLVPMPMCPLDIFCPYDKVKAYYRQVMQEKGAGTCTREEWNELCVRSE